MKLSDLYNRGSTWKVNWKKPEDSQMDYNGKYSDHDKAPMSALAQARHDEGIPSPEDDIGDVADANLDPLSFTNDQAPEDYSEIHDESEPATAVAMNVMPELRMVKKRREDPGHSETPRRARQKSRGKHWKGLPNRSGNQLTPPSKPRHRRFMGIPDNKGPGV